MRWVTYLSPSGGGTRVGALDDGDVMGSPDQDGLDRLLEAGLAALEAAHRRAVEGAIEIIVEPEARMCAPVAPRTLVPVRVGDQEFEIHPELVRGVDDAVLPEARVACVGVAAVAVGPGQALAYTPACLWLDGAGDGVQLILGPVLTTADELELGAVELATSVEEQENGRGRVDLGDPRLTSGPGRVHAVLPIVTPRLEADDELFVDAGELGTFEVRVGSQV
ncbi:hypothetical protein [Nocardiopsis sp. MG754419]|uniref:hypothetical protein n=1 Tax=Nocardiopsis sp. MG754419 TaxID=2259865 RepID=UPI001BAAC9AB|nr:hypothetical protein [Nocardiopsis sp. MG754419]MBR8742528.1 hypothetical protein [Nocardiopsis sp. MG754419]